MTDLPREVREMLDALEAEQRERYRPKPAASRTPAEKFLDELNGSCSPSVSVDLADAGWLE